MGKIYFAAAFMLFLTTACTMGIMDLSAQTREERNVEGMFTAVSVSSGIDLFVEQGDEVRIEVEADESDLDNIVVKVKNGTLQVFMETSFFNWFNSRSATVYVTMPAITSLSSSGGADLKSVGEIKSERIEIHASGGADANVALNVSEAVLSASGGADIEASGETGFLEAHSSGGADIKARHLNSKRAVISSSGGADCVVSVSDEIEASASGGADIDYYGSPKIKKISESGGGDVTGH